MVLPTLFGISLLGDAISIAAGLLIFVVLLMLVEGLDRV
jgi:hypothetical protein